MGSNPEKRQLMMAKLDKEKKRGTRQILFQKQAMLTGTNKLNEKRR